MELGKEVWATGVFILAVVAVLGIWMYADEKGNSDDLEKQLSDMEDEKNGIEEKYDGIIIHNIAIKGQGTFVVYLGDDVIENKHHYSPYEEHWVKIPVMKDYLSSITVKVLRTEDGQIQQYALSNSMAVDNETHYLTIDFGRL